MLCLAQWTERQIYSVLAIYEDRHELWGFKPDGTLLRRQLAASRQAELAELTGWRARLSLLLEVPHPQPRNRSLECVGSRGNSPPDDKCLWCVLLSRFLPGRSAPLQLCSLKASRNARHKPESHPCIVPPLRHCPLLSCGTTINN
jgi:hypothetical protein